MKALASIGSRLRALRTDRGWSLGRLADEAGVAKGYLHALENDDTKRPSVDVVQRVARALGTTIGDLTGESQPEELAPKSLPSSLREFARETPGLTPEDLRMLSGIRLRGQRPQTKEDWRFLYDAIRRSIRK